LSYNSCDKNGKGKKAREVSSMIKFYLNVVTLAISICLFCAPANIVAHEDVLFEKVYEDHLKTLLYLDEVHPKLLVMFSGTPGMGKTEIAKQLATYFHGVRISTDEIRALLRSHQAKTEENVENYLKSSLLKIIEASQNHLIILDCSVDRRYERCLQLAHEAGFATFLIRMEVDPEIVEKRVMQRGTDVANLLRNKAKSRSDYENFGAKYNADFYLDNNADRFEVPALLLEKLTHKLEEERAKQLEISFK
jgi:predicted kinase